MLRIYLLLASSIGMIACGADHAEVAPREQAPANAQSMESMSGQDIYELACGTCHDTGVGGAPISGNPADWADRSPFWQAVLMEHAEAGYIDMPVKGGNEELSDQQVDTAVLYMLGVTFPNRPAE